MAVGATVAGAVAFAFGLAWLVDQAPGPAKARPVCEAAVRTLFETRDPLELQRADLIIRHLDCSVRRWLPDAPAAAAAPSSP